MKILKEYTLDYVKRNKKSSISIMIAILVATTLIFSIAIFFYTMYMDNIEISIETRGNWHGELFDDTKGKDLEYVTAHQNVDKLMIKGQWKAAKINEITESKYPYIIFRGANTDYWLDMPDKDLIIEGRVPQNSNEIVLSKQYFEANPNIKINDKITLPVGNRIDNGEILEPRSTYRVGEKFVTEEEKTFTVVGKLDVSTSSAYPAFTGMIYLDESEMLPEDNLTVYLRFKNPRKIYTDLPQIAEQVGFKQDEYGNYLVRYNEKLLSKYLIFPPRDEMIKLEQLVLPLIYLLVAVLVVSVFVFIIHNAFALSLNSRIKQLGMFKSVGATPKQIKKSVIFEGLILSVIPIPLGLLAGYGFSFLIFNKINDIIKSMEEMEDFYLCTVEAGFPVIIITVILVLITVWFSALIPVRRIAKKTPISSIRQTNTTKTKKSKNYPFITKLFGFEGQLAMNFLNSYKKSFRMALISLTLSFLLFSIFLNITELGNAAKEILPMMRIKYDIALHIKNGTSLEKNAIDEFKDIPNIDEVTFSYDKKLATYFLNKDESIEIKESGGFERIAEENKYSLIKKNGKYRINTHIVAIDDKSFAEYCNSLNINPNEYYDLNNKKAIIINDVVDIYKSSPRDIMRIEFVNFEKDETLTISEKAYDSSVGDYEFNIAVGAVTNKYPEFHPYNFFDHYTLPVVMPMSVYENIVTNFHPENMTRSLCSWVYIKAERENIPQILGDMHKITDKYYGSGDIQYWDILKAEEDKKNSDVIMKLIVYSIAGLFALIGIVNAFTTVSTSIKQRRREFAMLRSIGISPRGMKKMLMLEGAFFGAKPIINSIPIIFLVILVFLKLTGVYLSEFVATMPAIPILVFALLILISISLEYFISLNQIKKETIVEAVKEDIV